VNWDGHTISKGKGGGGGAKSETRGKGSTKANGGRKEERWGTRIKKG